MNKGVGLDRWFVEADAQVHDRHSTRLVLVLRRMSRVNVDAARIADLLTKNPEAIGQVDLAPTSREVKE